MRSKADCRHHKSSQSRDHTSRLRDPLLCRHIQNALSWRFHRRAVQWSCAKQWRAENGVSARAGFFSWFPISVEIMPIIASATQHSCDGDPIVAHGVENQMVAD